VREQHADRAAVQVHTARLARLRLGLAERVALVALAAGARRRAGHLHDLLADEQQPAGEVDVSPAEPARLAAA
jgi:hypothetical protein